MADGLQRQTFLAGEGDAWFSRNREKLARPSVDPVEASIAGMDLKPTAMLEVGCSTGWRVQRLVKRFGASGFGVDPSAQAIEEGARIAPGVNLGVGTADRLPFDDRKFDLLIYGFCLYLCDRGDLFRIVAEGDRVLADGGYLVIQDFCVRRPHARIYHHDPSLMSYKMDHSQLFLAHPAYSLRHVSTYSADAGREPDEDNTVAVIVLRKDIAAGFPVKSEASARR
jgi:ubiquinone/menaquinone biosynthesis C-methylase UbiE